MNRLYKLNSKYINSFIDNVISRFRKEEVKSSSNFFRTLFKELNRLFFYIGGMVSSKRNIPKMGEYPNSKQYNKLIENIGIDIDKLYTTQRLLESDLSNLLNFNSSQRTKSFENLTTIQQEVYSVYIKSKNPISNEIVIPSLNPFTDANNLDKESSNVSINEERSSLSLSRDSTILKPIDIDNISMFFSDDIIPNNVNMYPNNKYLELGSHWEIDRKSSHFVDIKNRSINSQYRTMIIDDSSNNRGIGWCEFESVKTYIPNRINALVNLKNQIGKYFNKDKELIYLDFDNSLQSKYISNINTFSRNHKYKFSVPFRSSEIFTNEIIIDFEPNLNGAFPRINWDLSKIYSNHTGSETSHMFSKPIQLETNSNGIVRLLVRDGFIKPTRIELILEYGNDSQQWIPMDFYMSHYIYSTNKNFISYQESLGSNISLALTKSYDIFVDSEPNKTSEKKRALNVLIEQEEI